MNLEQQVTSLELSRKLNDLGVKHHSLFSWYAFENPLIKIFKETDLDEDMWHLGYSRDCSKGGADWVYSAFTASELMQLLPYHITSKEPEPFNSYRIYITGSVIVKNPGCIDPIRTHIVNYKCDTINMHNTDKVIGKFLTHNIWDENPANALAKMLAYLIENSLMEIPQ